MDHMSESLHPTKNPIFDPKISQKERSNVLKSSPNGYNNAVAFFVDFVKGFEPSFGYTKIA